MDGSLKSIAVYPSLAEFLGTAFNQGNEGADNFRLPESRGEFLRGWDHGRGVDADRGVGTYQTDDFKSHFHNPLFATGPVTTAAGAVLGITNSGAGDRGGTGAQYAGNGGGSTYISSVGGTETRPRNSAVIWCIKAWNAPINRKHRHCRAGGFGDAGHGNQAGNGQDRHAGADRCRCGRRDNCHA
nr:tail fiber protein [Pseudomonas sp. S11A4]